MKNNKLKIFSVTAENVELWNRYFEANEEDKKQILEDYKSGIKNPTDKTEIRLYKRTAYINDSIFVHYANKHGVSERKGICYDSIDVRFRNYKGEITTESKILRDRWYDDSKGLVMHWDDKHTVTYVHLDRSPGKAKKGSVIFVRKDLADNFRDFLSMGLYKKMPEEKAKLVELSAYQSLSTATAVDYISIDPESMLVIADVASDINKQAAIVELTKQYREVKEINKKELDEKLQSIGYTVYQGVAKKKGLKLVNCHKKSLSDVGVESIPYVIKNRPTGKNICSVRRDLYNITNIMFDGQGLIDQSIFPDSMNGFVYCRNHFFKSCLFVGNIQQYFKDRLGDEYDTAEVTDYFGYKRRLRDIKVIVSDKSLKWLKFVDLMGGTLKKAYKYWVGRIKAVDCKFAIVKTAHKSKYSAMGDIQRASYQIVNTLFMSDEELESIADMQAEIVNRMKVDDIEFLKYAESTEEDYKPNKAFIELYNRNPNIANTALFRTWKTKEISDLKEKRIKQGKIFLPGDNLTIVFNPIAMLEVAMGNDPENDKCFAANNDYIECYTHRFVDGTMLAGFRNPHNAMNNIMALKNVYANDIVTYFPNLGDNVLVLNAIHTDVQARAQGCDSDSDYFYVTDNKTVAECAIYCYKHYPTIVNAIPENSSCGYGKYDYSIVDNKIAENNMVVGLSSNVAQIALSYYHDTYNKTDIKDQELEDIAIICSVLAQIAIDGAKRMYDINALGETKRLQKHLKQKYGIEVPEFYKLIKEFKAKQRGKRFDDEDYPSRVFKCPMDQIPLIIDKKIIKYIDRRHVLDYYEIMDEVLEDKNTKMIKRSKAKRIKDYMMELSEIEKSIGFENDMDTYCENINNAFNDFRDKVKKMNLDAAAIYSLVYFIFTDRERNKLLKDCSKIKLLAVLYQVNPDAVIGSVQKMERFGHKIA